MASFERASTNALQFINNIEKLKYVSFLTYICTQHLTIEKKHNQSLKNILQIIMDKK